MRLVNAHRCSLFLTATVQVLVCSWVCAFAPSLACGAELRPERAKQYHLLAFNLNGMTHDGAKAGKQIMPLGQGDLDLKLLRILRNSGWHGPLGILNHTDEDAQARLQDNLEGFDWLVAQLEGRRSDPKPTPRSWHNPG
jgi:hypothetical protein